MPLTSQKRIPVAKEFVRLGFGDAIDASVPFKAQEFLTETLTTIEAEQVIPVVSQYNQFNGEAVAKAISKFQGRVMGWKFGCAGSPLLIVALAPWTHQIEDTPPRTPSGRMFTAEENAVLVSQLRNVFINQLKADKFEMNGSDEYEFGAWWD
jgi:hypothetical protein